MDPLMGRSAFVALGLPRASGDGPASVPVAGTTAWAAPRERGWTLVGDAGGGYPAGCPARAGMDLPLTDRGKVVGGLPRASGDGPRVGDAQPLHSVAAPRERGWTLPVVLPLSDFRGCPARAGMDPLSAAAAVSSSWLPRASGDGPPSPMLCPRS